MSQYYIGSVCKRAIGYLFINRSIGLVIFSITTFFLLGLLWKYVFSDANILHAARFVYSLHPAGQLHGFMISL